MVFSGENVYVCLLLSWQAMPLLLSIRGHLEPKEMGLRHLAPLSVFIPGLGMGSSASPGSWQLRGARFRAWRFGFRVCGGSLFSSRRVNAVQMRLLLS